MSASAHILLARAQSCDHTARGAGKCCLVTSPRGKENRFWRVHSSVCFLGQDCLDWWTMTSGRGGRLSTGSLPWDSLGCPQAFVGKIQTMCKYLHQHSSNFLHVHSVLSTRPGPGTRRRAKLLLELWGTPLITSPVLGTKGPGSLGRESGRPEGFVTWRFEGLR